MFAVGSNMRDSIVTMAIIAASVAFVLVLLAILH
jgi:hypothetical protein